MHMNTNNAGTVRLVIFDPALDPEAWPPYDKYVGQTNTFSLVWTDRERGMADLYVHDEHTLGGIKVASTDTSSGSGVPAGERYEVVGYNEFNEPVAKKFTLHEWLSDQSIISDPSDFNAGDTLAPIAIASAPGVVPDLLAVLFVDRNDQFLSSSIPTRNGNGNLSNRSHPNPSWLNNSVAAQTQLTVVNMDMIQQLFNHAALAQVTASVETVEDMTTEYTVTVTVRNEPPNQVGISQARITIERIAFDQITDGNDILTMETDSTGTAVFTELTGPATYNVYVNGLRVPANVAVHMAA